MDALVIIKKYGRHQEDFDISSWKTNHDDRKKPLAIEPFAMHPPRFGTVSRNHYSHSKILTPLSHCFKLTILQKC